jgi:S1-C subfamily serine protease
VDAFSRTLLKSVLLGAWLPSAVWAQEDAPRWDSTITLRSCSSAPPALPEGMETLLGGVVTIETESGHGAGFIASPDGFVFTAAHVIKGATKIDVRAYNGMELPGELVRLHPAHDVAVLRIPGSGHPCLIPPQAAPPLGSEIYAIGAPGDPELSHSVAKGIISGRREWESHRFIQTDASLNAGNSGGPLVSSQGEVLGVVSWKIAGLGVEGLSFGIPVESVVELLGLEWGEASSGSGGALYPTTKPESGAQASVAAATEIVRPGQPVDKWAMRQPASLGGPISLGAVGAGLIAATWGYTQVRDPITKLEWYGATGLNTIGWVGVAAGGGLLAKNIAWNKKVARAKEAATD